MYIPSEKEEALALVAEFRRRGYKFHHSPNETGHTPEAKRRAIRVKREGTSKGFPDYIVIADGKVFAIELKRIKDSYPSPEQKAWIAAFEAAGVISTVAKGAKAALDFIDKYVTTPVVDDSSPF